MKNPPRIDRRRPTSEQVQHKATAPLRTFAQCGAIMGCTLSNAHKLEKSALTKLRKGLIESGIVDEQGRVVRGVEG